MPGAPPHTLDRVRSRTASAPTTGAGYRTTRRTAARCARCHSSTGRRADRGGRRPGSLRTRDSAWERRGRARPPPMRARQCSACGGGTQRIPTSAGFAPILPARRAGAARRAVVWPVEPVSETQRSTILVERLAGLAPTLEDRAEEGMYRRQIGCTDLDLLELVGRLVEHLELEAHAAERGSEREIVGRALGRGAIERDHPAGAVLLAVGALESREQRQHRVRLGGALPRAHGFARVARRLEGITESHRRRHEVPVGPQGGAEVAGGGGRLAVRQLEAPELVVAGGEPLGFRVTLARWYLRENVLLERDRLVPVARLDREIAQRVERADVRRPALDDVAEPRACLFDMAARAGRFGGVHRLHGLRIVLAAGGRALEPQQA